MNADHGQLQKGESVMYTQTYTHAHARARAHACTHVCIHTRVQTLIDPPIYFHAARIDVRALLFKLQPIKVQLRGQSLAGKRGNAIGEYLEGENTLENTLENNFAREDQRRSRRR